MTDNAIITQAQIKAIEERKALFIPLLRELIVNGKKLTDQQITGRAAFAAMQDLDPITEVHTLVDNQGNTMAHTMAINGYRRKCAEQVEAKLPGGTVDLEFVEIEKTKLPPNSFVGYECRLRESISYQDWQKRILNVGKTLKEVLGTLDYSALIEACGPAPVYTGVGIVYSNELSDWKDRNFNPIERAKKRAELNARKRRFPTNAPIQENEGVAPLVDADVIEGAFTDTIPGGNGKETKRSVEQNMRELGFETTPSQPSGIYTREDAAKDLAQPSEPTQPETPSQPELFGDGSDQPGSDEDDQEKQSIGDQRRANWPDEQISLKLAEGITTSDTKEKYLDLPLDKLVIRYNVIQAKLEKNKLTPEQRAENELKRDVAKIILDLQI